MTKKAAKSDATGAAEENTSGADNPAVTSEPTTADPAAPAADGGSADSAASAGATIEATQTDTTSPQQLTGAVADGCAGATDKPMAASKAAPKVSVKALYVVGACPVLHDHEVYQPDDELELTSAEAARLAGKVTAASASDDTAR